MGSLDPVELVREIAPLGILKRKPKQREADEAMPYSSVADLPPAAQKLTPDKKKQFLAVFNSAYADHKDEGRAFASAWSAVGGKEADEESGHG